MASSRIALGLLAIATIVSAIVVTGCGGGSSASGTTSAATSASAPTAESEGGGNDETAGKSSEAGEDKKKHPPLDLPKGKPEQGPTSQQQASVPTADIEMNLAGSIAVGVTPLPVDNTCKGKNVSPALEWENIPSGTEELVLFAMNLGPVNGKLYFDWAVGGLDPSLTGIKEGDLPNGAVVGRNSAGQTKYSICPKGGEGETYVFALYAVTRKLSPEPGFEPLPLRKEAIKNSPSVGILTLAAAPG